MKVNKEMIKEDLQPELLGHWKEGGRGGEAKQR